MDRNGPEKERITQTAISKNAAWETISRQRKAGRRRGSVALTKRQKEYCKRRAAGDSYSKAYKAAGYSEKQSTRTATNNAYALEHTSARSNEILSKIADLQRRAEQGGILKREQRQQLLSDLAMDEEGARADRIRALDLLAKMSGDYTERVIYEGNSHVSIEDARAEAWDSLKSE